MQIQCVLNYHSAVAIGLRYIMLLLLLFLRFFPVVCFCPGAHAARGGVRPVAGDPVRGRGLSGGPVRVTGGLPAADGLRGEIPLHLR